MAEINPSYTCEWVATYEGKSMEISSTSSWPGESKFAEPWLSPTQLILVAIPPVTVQVPS